VSAVLARIFAERGDKVTVITNTPSSGTESDTPFRVLRRPDSKALIEEIGQSDIVLQSNISLRLAWPLWLLYPRKPFVMVHHTPIARPDGRLAWQDRLKRLLLLRPRCASVSRYLADTIQKESNVITNPYDNSTFRQITGVVRDGDLLFVGRFVSAKGVDTLLHAYAIVLKYRPQTTLSIVGSGPEEGVLRDLAQSLGIAESAHFLGPRKGNELATLMNQHKILVVPSRSRPPEACPVVPVEAIACGCVPVVSRMGGLPESVGDAGALFEEGNIEELAKILLDSLNSPAVLDSYRAKAEQHLSRFLPEAVAAEYEFHFALAGCQQKLSQA